MRNCPFCAEEIQDAAVKCKHCGEFLAASQEEGSNDPRLGADVVHEGSITLGRPVAGPKPAVASRASEVVTPVQRETMTLGRPVTGGESSIRHSSSIGHEPNLRKHADLKIVAFLLMGFGSLAIYWGLTGAPISVLRALGLDVRTFRADSMGSQTLMAGGCVLILLGVGGYSRWKRQPKGETGPMSSHMMRLLAVLLGCFTLFLSWKLGLEDPTNSSMGRIGVGFAGFAAGVVMVMASFTPAWILRSYTRFELKVTPAAMGCFVMLVLPAMAFVGCSVFFSSSGGAPSVAPVASGNWVITADTAMAATSDSAATEMYALIRARDTVGIHGMVSQGRVLMLPKGTKMVMNKVGFASHTMTVLDGEFAGQSCIVATEQVHHQ